MENKIYGNDKKLIFMPKNGALTFRLFIKIVNIYYIVKHRNELFLALAF